MAAPATTLVLIGLLLLLATAAQAQDARAMELYNALMQQRAANGLPSIPLCPGLNTVAAAHVEDSTANPPSGDCNMHSWSQSSRWSGCCFTNDFAASQCIWDKPRELAGYPGNGFEISHGGPWGNVTPQSAVEGWMGSSGHRDVILNVGMWSQPWSAVGVAIGDNYAHVWFGHEACT